MSPELKLQLAETITQIIAFVIFFWVMKKYAWGPLQVLLDERQRKIASRFEEIQRKHGDVEKLVAEHTAQMRNIDQEGRARIQEAVADGRRVAAELIENARGEAAQIAERAQRNVQLELAKARLELRNEVIALTIGASERLMRERLNDEGNRRLVASFIQDLENQAAPGGTR